MKNSVLINDLGPHLLTDYTSHRPISSWGSWLMGVTLWAATLAILCWISLGVAQAETTPSDPLVMKVYPDGTKVVLRWSEVGKQVDNGEKFGGAPRIVAYDPAKDGIVPIGEPGQKAESNATPAAVPSSSSVVSPDQPAKMDYSNASPDDYDNYGAMEGFGFRTSAGPAFQQSISYRDISDSQTRGNSITFQPGIRFDLEPFFNITDWFSLGIQSAFIYNQIHSIIVGGNTFYSDSPTMGSGSFYQVPILLNFRFQFPSEGPVRGYFTGAPGGVWNFSTISAFDQNSTSYQWNFTFQLGGGFIYNVAPGLDLDTSFKMLCTPNPLGEGAEAQSKASYNYSATIGLVWRF